jgi:hypothetical protein
MEKLYEYDYGKEHKYYTHKLGFSTCDKYIWKMIFVLPFCDNFLYFFTPLPVQYTFLYINIQSSLLTNHIKRHRYPECLPTHNDFYEKILCKYIFVRVSMTMYYWETLVWTMTKNFGLVAHTFVCCLLYMFFFFFLLFFLSSLFVCDQTKILGLGPHKIFSVLLCMHCTMYVLVLRPLLPKHTIKNFAFHPARFARTLQAYQKYPCAS